MTKAAYEAQIVSRLKITLRQRWRSPSLAAIVLMLVAGCAGDDLSMVQRYREPATAPAPPRRVIISEPVDAVQEKVLAGLEESPFEVTRVDPEGRFIVAEYSGDPQPYVDCGMLATGPRSAGDPAPAAAAERRLVTELGTGLERMMRLDGRLVMTFQGDDGRTAVDSDVTYVVTRLIREEGTGRWGGETIGFSSGRRGTFPRGTMCQPTGVLETAAYDALSAAAATAAREPAPPEPEITVAPLETVAPPEEAPEPPGSLPPVTVAPFSAPPAPLDQDLAALAMSAVPQNGCGEVVARRMGPEQVALQGVASDFFTMDSMVNAVQLSGDVEQVENRIAVLSVPACDAFKIARDLGGAGPDELRLEIMSLRGDVLQQGDVLQLAIDVPEDKRSLHLSYFRQNGMVSHLVLDAPPDLAEDTAWVIDTQEEIGPPFGSELILVVATADPLFAVPRPGVEPEQDFLPALEQALSRRSEPAEVGIDCAVLRTVELVTGAETAAPIRGQVCFRN